MNNLKIIVGDWSKDGHNQTEEFTIESSLNEKQLWKAYEAGTKIIGFNLVEDVAHDYEDDMLSLEKINLLKDHGYENLDGDEDMEEGISLYPDFHLDIFLFIVKLGHPSFEYKELEAAELHIGGYGLFS